MCIARLAKKFHKHIKEIHIIRNCFEKCAKINDDSIKYLQKCPNLERLSMVYSRKFRDDFQIYISSAFPKLKYLNIKECPIQSDLSVLNEGCPLLEEIDMSNRTLDGMMHNPDSPRVYNPATPRETNSSQ